jgi:maltose alpha-D-glucosyltransferase/alpha-amylase
MVLSFHKVAFEGFMCDPQLQEADRIALQPFAALWAHYMSGFFIEAYMAAVKGAHLLPAGANDLEMMWQNYLLQRAIQAFNEALSNDPSRLIIPLTLIRNILREEPPAISSALPKGAAADIQPA